MAATTEIPVDAPAVATEETAAPATASTVAADDRAAAETEWLEMTSTAEHGMAAQENPMLKLAEAAGGRGGGQDGFLDVDLSGHDVVEVEEDGSDDEAEMAAKIEAQWEKGTMAAMAAARPTAAAPSRRCVPR